MDDAAESLKRVLPNIVFIMADQLGAAFVGCYGSGVDSTPNLDALAAEGVRFDRFYATSPVCAPNRATILTGRSPEIHGIVTNNLALQTDNPTYAHVLLQHGYRTGCFGKIHQTPMHWLPLEDAGFLGFDESVISEDPKWGAWIDWIRETYPEHYPVALAMTNGHSALRGATWLDTEMGASDQQFQLKAQVYPEIMAGRLDGSNWDRMYPSPLPAEAHDTVFITERGLDFIRRAEAQPEQPFFCHISYVDPHDPYDPPEPYASMFSPDAMPNPLPAEWQAQGPALLDDNRDGYLHFREICEDVAAIKRLRALYHGSIKLIDDQVGRVIDYLKASGLWERTIVVFTTDHGDMMGDHGLIAKGTPHYDTGIRCPMIVAGGPVRRGAVTDRLSCSLDLFPTFCEWGGVPAEALPPCEGKSFAPPCTGSSPGDEGWDEIAVSIGSVDSVVTAEGWRLTRFSPQDTGQMFDLNADPGEQHNLYDDLAYRDEKVALLERLVKVRMLPRLEPQYRNLAWRDGRKWLTNDARGWPDYPAPSSPWLVDGPRPEWKGRNEL